MWVETVVSSPRYTYEVRVYEGGDTCPPCVAAWWRNSFDFLPPEHVKQLRHGDYDNRRPDHWKEVYVGRPARRVAFVRVDIPAEWGEIAP